MVLEQRITEVRRFNRFYTRTIGVLGDGVQRTPYTLTEARLMFELAQSDETETVVLRQLLGLDPGYLSRILARFEADGLVRLQRSTVDARRQVVALTPGGRRVFATLNQHAIEDMGVLLGKLGDADQRRLLSAMATIERLWDAPAEGNLVIREPHAGELGWVLQRHGELYAEEYDWNSEFETLVAGIIGEFQPGRDAAWIAELGGVAAGSVFCYRKDDETAQLRLLFVEPWARGHGIGARLVDTCLEFARLHGYSSIGLWTNAQLHAARRIYERAGFELASEDSGEGFGHRQIFQNWRRAL